MATYRGDDERNWRLSPRAGKANYRSSRTLRTAALYAAGVATTLVLASYAWAAPVPPGPPTLARAVAGDNSAVVSFAAPAATGSSAIVRFRAVSNPGGHYGTSAGGPITIGALSNGTAYTFTVRATSAHGQTGTPSKPSNVVTPSAYEATTVGRWSLLIALAVLLLGVPLVLVPFALFATHPNATSAAGETAVKQSGPLRRIVGAYGSLVGGAAIGSDVRTSTSKTIPLVWTYSVAAALLSIVIAKWLGQGDAFEQHLGLQPAYALLIGGPLGAAIIAKGIVTSQVANDQASKPVANNAQLLDLVQNDQGQTDLGDLQYVLFNVIALIFFYGAFLAAPQEGLPTIPAVLLGLTSVSAVGFVGKKILTTAVPTITCVVPTTVVAGEKFSIFGSSLMPDSSGVTTVSFRDEHGTSDELVVTPASTAEGTVIDLEAPTNLTPGRCELFVAVNGKKVTYKGFRVIGSSAPAPPVPATAKAKDSKVAIPVEAAAANGGSSAAASIEKVAQAGQGRLLSSPSANAPTERPTRAASRQPAGSATSTNGTSDASSATGGQGSS